MKKKSLTLALALVILSFALSACGGTEPQDIGSALGDVSGVTAPPTPAAAPSAEPLPSLAPSTPDTQPSAQPTDDGGGQDVNLDDFLYDWLDFSSYPLTPDVLVLIAGLGAAGWYWGLPYVKGLMPGGELPAVSYSCMSREPDIEIDYEAVDAIYPSLYNTTDYILRVDGENVNSVVTYKTQQEWLDYIQNGYGDGSGGCYVLNCGLATALGLLPLTN